MRGIDDRVAVVTGACGGIGRAVVQQLVDSGARGVLVDVQAEAARALSAELPPGRSVAVGADVSTEPGVDAFVTAALRAYGRIDLFHNNAGIEGRICSIFDVDIADYDRVMAVNARGVLLGLRAVMRQMREQGDGGAIVNTASLGGLRGAPGLTPYVMSKHAVIGATRCAALEGAALGIRVNAVCPGATSTHMMDRIEDGTADGPPTGVRARIEASVPMGRYARADEVAALVVWLLSSEASFVTGAAYPVDGGKGAG